MRRIAWLGLPLLVACSSPSEPSLTQDAPAPATGEAAIETPAPPEPEPIERPLGSYTFEHTILVVCEDPDWCEEKATDRLKIAAADNGAIAIELELVHANGHLCYFRDTLTHAGERLWEWRAAEGKPECHLQLRWKLDTLEVSSKGCNYFCGARGHLDGKFSYSGGRQK